MTKMNVEIPRFVDIVSWLKEKKAVTEKDAYHIQKIGERSKLNYFLAWVEDDVIKLMPHPKARAQVGYLLKRKEWDSFIVYRRALSPSERNKSRSYSEHLVEWGCTNRIYYPSISAISRQYFSEADK